MSRRHVSITFVVMFVLLLASAGTAFAVPTASFGSLYYLGTGYGEAYSNEVGDLNSDGHPDIAVPHYTTSGSGLRTYLNNGSGGFSLAGTSSVSGSAVRLADFDRDGDLDAVVKMYFGTGHNLGIMKGDDTGKLVLDSYIDHVASTTFLQVGDFNGDSIPDLAEGTDNGPTVNVYLGDGDCTFTLSSVISGLWTNRAGAVGDVNRDGKQDLVVTGSNGISVRLGDGTGVGFTALPDLPIGAANPYYAVLKDLNRDGILDLAVGYLRGTCISVWDGDGTGDFSNRRDIPVPLGTKDLKAADVNRDGTLDLLVGGIQPGGADWSLSEIRALLNDGCGNFPAQIAPTDDGETWGAGLQAINAADFNGDGKPELVSTNVNSNPLDNLTIFRNLTAVDHSLDIHVSSVNTVTNASRLEPGDFNRDGKPDLAVASMTNGTVALLLGDGDGGLTDAGALGGAAVSIMGLDVVDFDRDGIEDLLTFDDQAVRFWKVGAGGGITLSTSSGSPGSATGAAIDSNRDGNPDAVAVNYSTSFSQVFTGAGNGSLFPGRVLDAGSWVTDVAVADFNGDSIQDVATVDGIDRLLHLALGASDGGFSTSTTGPVSTSWADAIESGDINGDGAVDVVAVSGGALRPILNDGDGPSIAGTLATGTASDVVLTDFDLDGTLDAVTCGSDGHLSYYDNNGSGSFTMLGWMSVGTALDRITATDLDRDGRPDIAATGGNKVFVLPNDVAAPYTTAVFSPYSPDGANGWYVTTPTVTLVSNEPVPPRFSLNDSDWAVYDGSPLVSAEGTNTLSFWSIDFPQIHLEATQTVTFKVDTTAPVTTIEGLPAGLAKADVEFTLSAVDAAAGVATRFYRLDSGPPVSYVDTVTISADGATTVGWWSVDNAGNTETEQTAVVVIDHAEPPVTAPSSFSMNEDTQYVGSAPGVLLLDTDPEGGSLTAALGTGPSHGSLTLSSSGAFSYTPGLDWNGTDTFTYIASNAYLSAAPETVTINVLPVADPPTALDLSWSYALENGAVGTVIGRFSATDVDSTSFTYSLVPGGDASAFAIVGDELRTAASFDYETKTSYSITVRVTDETDKTFDQPFTIDVMNDNEAPAAAEDSYETTAGATLDVPAPGVLGNDTDPDGNGLDAYGRTTTQHGLLTLRRDGSFTYEPDSGFLGTDSFTYVADDGQGKGRLSSPPTTVTIMVHALESRPPTTTSNALAAYTGEAIVSLVATDDISGVAQTFWKLDGAAAATGTTVHVVTTGAHTLDFWSVDNADNVEAAHTVTFTVASGIIPVEGADRYGTAIRTSQVAFPAGATHAVICRGDVWADVSGGSALAGAVNGPLLLTRPDSVSAALLAELRRLGVTDVYILGDEVALSRGVADALGTAVGGASHVTRIGGANRYATAALVASETAAVLTADGGYDGKVFLTTGEDFPDAIAVAPLATRLHRPIVLTRRASLSPEAATSLAALGQNGVHILGSTNAVSATVASQVAGIVGASDVHRLEGPDRYRTAIAIAEYGISQGLHWNGVAIGTGTNFPDALAGGVMQGVFDSVVLLTPPDHLHPAVAAVLRAHKTEIGFCRILGGPAAVSEATRVQIHDALE